MLRSVDKTGTAAARASRPAGAGVVRPRLAAAVFTLATLAALFGALPRPAAADTQTVDSAAPIVRINVRQGNVTVRTWDREAVSVESDTPLSVERRTANQPGQQIPSLVPEIAAPANRESGEPGPSLPPESFVAAPIAPGPRDVIVVKSMGTDPSGTVTVNVPGDAIFVYAHVGAGRLNVLDYRGGTLIATMRVGAMTLANDGGTVFAQTLRGPIVARASTFDRIRARSVFGNVAFERCTVRQIEASTITGSIVYDGGSFEPGLARFESVRGNIAIGASGNVQYGAHADADGHVYTNFTGRVQVDARNGLTSATVGGGGPVVTATTQGGNVFLYDGTLHNRPQLPPEWQPAVETLQRPAFGNPREARSRFVPPPAFRRFKNFR
jgi:hypothetical protein